jgi:hypothetical protein
VLETHASINSILNSVSIKTISCLVHFDNHAMRIEITLPVLSFENTILFRFLAL